MTRTNNEAGSAGSSCSSSGGSVRSSGSSTNCTNVDADTDDASPWFSELASRMAAHDERTAKLLQEAATLATKLEAELDAAIEGEGEGVSPLELDLVVGVGSWRAIYAIGAFSVLRLLHQRGKIKLRRFRGASGGAQAAAVMSQIGEFTDSDMETW